MAGRRTTSHRSSPRVDKHRANHALGFINGLTHTKGEWAGQPFALRPWQTRIIRDVFGRVVSDARVVRTAYIEIPRKNGKSTLAAGLALYMLLGDGEAGAEVYSAAADRDQASLVFNAAAQMVRNDPGLSARLKIVESQKRIVDYRTGSFYRAISAEAYSKHGFNASAVIYDELHVAPNRDLWDVLTSSMSARREPLTVAITTAGFDRHSICWEIHSYAEQVAAGQVDDPSFYPAIWAAPLDADWTSEKVWRAANPALGDFRSLDEMRVACKRAQEIPAQENVFRRLALCQWTEQATRWLQMDKWDAITAPVNPLAFAGRECFGGLDLSTTTDLSAFALVFPDGIGGFDVVSHFWCPEEGIEKRSVRDRVPYREWQRRGFLTATAGNVVDYDVIRETIKTLAGTYRIREIAFDRWNSSQLVTDLTADGATMVPFGQGFASMSAPAKEFEKMVTAGTLRHGGNPILRWMAGHVSARQDPAGNIKPDKAKSADRIDGIVATIMALGRAIVAEKVTQPFIGGGVMVL